MWTSWQNEMPSQALHCNQNSEAVQQTGLFRQLAPVSVACLLRLYQDDSPAVCCCSLQVTLKQIWQSIFVVMSHTKCPCDLSAYMPLDMQHMQQPVVRALIDVHEGIKALMSETIRYQADSQVHLCHASLQG